MSLHQNSLAAYDDVKKTLPRRQAEVLAVLEQYPQGLTGEEIATLLQRHPYVVRPRLTELAAEDVKLIIDTCQTKLNSHGKRETVWRRWYPIRAQQEFWQ